MSLSGELEKWLKHCRKLVIVGIGNPLRGDDALGLHVLKELEGKVPPNVKLIEGETTPESFTEEIEQSRPSHVLFVDAAHFRAEPGKAKLFQTHKIGGAAVFTHAIPLSFLAEILQKDTNAKVALLGVQPKAIELSEKLSPELTKATKKIVELLKNAVEKACK
ncbi:MAG TPA: hydrogenase maturation peptidase HycI [Candidatus Bathyarchaeia archaeon]|nr:hydrogenase maturation peptidase HycI [Candidatus Bathyarchaeia archaeon]